MEEQTAVIHIKRFGKEKHDTSAIVKEVTLVDIRDGVAFVIEDRKRHMIYPLFQILHIELFTAEGKK